MAARSSLRASRGVRLLISLERAVTNVSVTIACVLLASAASVGFFQVITRFVLKQPSTWSEPLVRTLLVWMAYLGLCGVIRAGALVSVDALYRACRGRARRFLQAAISLATLSLLLILVWYGTNLALRVRFQNLAGLEIPVVWAYAAIPVGAAVAVLSVLAHFFDPVHEELETAV
jgi:TRAP-type C4-dicarboxylate transport system permease small subunit